MKISNIKKETLPQHTNVNKEGILSVLEFSSLSFTPKRILYVCNTPKGSIRGCHAHYKNCQIILCMQGNIEVSLWDGNNTRVFSLYKGDYVYCPSMVWDEQKYLTGEDIMLSIHSEKFDTRDHITDKNLFLRLTGTSNALKKLFGHYNTNKIGCLCE